MGMNKFDSRDTKAARSLVVVFSYHHGNTRKVADAIAGVLGAEVRTPDRVTPEEIAGGEKTGDLESLKIIRDSVKVGGAGVCVGRNSVQRDDTTAFVKALCSVVHDEVDPEKALGKKR